VADIELHTRLPVPAVTLALQEIAEELLLQRNAIIRVVVRPMLNAVHLQPLLLGGGAEETLEIAAWGAAAARPSLRRRVMAPSPSTSLAALPRRNRHAAGARSRPYRGRSGLSPSARP